MELLPLAQQVIFYLLAIVIVVCSILAVTTRRILRAATYLLFVLLSTAGIYFMLGTNSRLCRRYFGSVCLFYPTHQQARRVYR